MDSLSPFANPLLYLSASSSETLHTLEIISIASSSNIITSFKSCKLVKLVSIFLASLAAGLIIDKQTAKSYKLVGLNFINAILIRGDSANVIPALSPLCNMSNVFLSYLNSSKSISENLCISYNCDKPRLDNISILKFLSFATSCLFILTCFIDELFLFIKLSSGTPSG